MSEQDKEAGIVRENALTEYLVAGINGYLRRRPETIESDVVIALCNVLVVQLTTTRDAKLRGKQQAVTLGYLVNMLARIEPELAEIYAQATKEAGAVGAAP